MNVPVEYPRRRQLLSLETEELSGVCKKDAFLVVRA
jgi:hypothetical protein